MAEGSGFLRVGLEAYILILGPVYSLLLGPPRCEKPPHMLLPLHTVIPAMVDCGLLKL